MHTTASDIDDLREEVFRDFPCTRGRVRIQDLHDCIAILLTQEHSWHQSVFLKTNEGTAGECVASTGDDLRELLTLPQPSPTHAPFDSFTCRSGSRPALHG